MVIGTSTPRLQGFYLQRLHSKASRNVTSRDQKDQKDLVTSNDFDIWLHDFDS